MLKGTDNSPKKQGCVKMAVHPNSLKNLRGGRKKGSKNKTTLAKKDIEKLLETQDDIKEKAEKINVEIKKKIIYLN